METQDDPDVAAETKRVEGDTTDVVRLEKLRKVDLNGFESH